jgi:hypothetical protein
MKMALTIGNDFLPIFATPLGENRLYWRLVRVVEGARLESVYTRKGIKGSNPLVSAK